jgi:hypothetical protein
MATINKVVLPAGPVVNVTLDGDEITAVTINGHP